MKEVKSSTKRCVSATNAPVSTFNPWSLILHTSKKICEISAEVLLIPA